MKIENEVDQWLTGVKN